MLFLIISFIGVHWGRESFLKEYVSFPVEDHISAGTQVTVFGQIYEIEQASNYQILYLKNNSISYRSYQKDQKDYNQERKVQEPYLMIYEDSGQKFRLGNTVKVSGKLKFFEEERNPGGFSQKAYYRSRKIASYLWSDKIQCTDESIWRFRGFLNNIRLRWKSLLLDVSGEEDGGVLCAILLGDKRQIDAEVKELYQVNGMAHILAISGLHLSFVGLGFYRFIRRLTGSYPLGGAAGICFLLLYILMIGSSVSAVRALIMFCIRVGADMAGRVYDAPTSVAVAAAGVILWRPLSFYDAGFQLSFGAVCGIIFLYPLISGEGIGKQDGDVKEDKINREQSSIEKRIEEGMRRSSIEKWGMGEGSIEKGIKGGPIGDKRRTKKSGLMSGIRDSLTASLCIQAATLPAILFHYYEFPLYSVFLNLIVIPLMSLLLVFGFAGSLLCLFWQGGGGLCLRLCGLILKLYELLCRGSCLLPMHQVITGKPAAAGILVYSLCLVICMFLLQGRFCRLLKIGVFTVGMSALVFACPAVSYRGLEVTFLDVGQGDGIFIRERGGLTCLIDGGSSDVSKVGKYRIEPFLKVRGVSEIDYVFVTHGDSDHISGLEELLERQEIGVKISCVVFPEQELWDEKLENLCLLAKENGTRTAVMHPGQRVEGKHLILGCLAPDREKLIETGNAASLVLEGNIGELDILFTGDVEGEGENLLTEVLEKEYEVLKVAHHGSKNSTSEEFLEIVRPKLAVISAGRDNRYGHPHEETMEKLEKEGAAILTTAQSGAVILKMNGKDMDNLKIIQYNPAL